MKRTVRVFLCLLALVCGLVGCADPVGKQLVFEDIMLTLPADFIDLSQEDYARNSDFLYGRKTLVLMGLAEKKASLNKMTLSDYTGYLISGNGLSTAPRAFGNGYLFSYEAAIQGEPYTYITAVYEAEVNFWILQFYCPSKNLTENQPEIDIILEGIQPVA